MNWLESFRQKDSSIGSGWTMYNSGNGMGPDPDARFGPNAKEISSLGDISSLLSYGGQLKTNSSPALFFNPFDGFGAADNISQGKLMNYLTKKEEAADTSVLTNLLIDDKRGDTITHQQFIRRSSSSGTKSYLNSDGTLTTIPKYNHNNNK